MPSEITQLVYYSRMLAGSDSLLQDILTQAQQSNDKAFLTGALWLNGDYFIQVLEGDPKRVSSTFLKIAQDSRHKDVVLMGCKGVDQRMFGSWSMACVMDTPKNREIFLRYSADDTLNPARFNHDRMVTLIRSMTLSSTHN